MSETLSDGRSHPPARGGDGWGAVPPAAKWLGLAGLIPFFGGAAAVLLGIDPLGIPAATVLVGYGVAILSFMGGCRWGFAAAGLGAGPSYGLLAVSVLPALYGWAVALAEPQVAMLLLAPGFLALLLADLALTRRAGAPAWWPALRWPLSLGAAASLIAGAIA